MEYYKEEEFYQDNNGPAEYYEYSSYIFWQDSRTEWGQDYDMFVFVKNSWIPYIRKVEKRGACLSPCGGGTHPATDGTFATKSSEERDKECPKIAFGIIASFLINLRFDNEQEDFVLKKEISAIMQEYYNRFRDKYMSSHNGLKYQDVSYEQKELDFIKQHIAQENEAYSKTILFKDYKLLYHYSSRFFNDYMSFLDRNRRQLQKKIHPSRIIYSIQKCSEFEKDFIKVYIKDNLDIQKVQTILSALPSVRKVNIGNSTTPNHLGENYVILYPEIMYSYEDVIDQIQSSLDTYQSNVTYGQLAPDRSAHFANIESQIIEELDNAHAMIDVCVAWFTNDKLRDKLLEKQSEGVKVRVITYNDGVNRTHGVDLTPFEHKELQGKRGGLMHDKFCIVDNATSITGSYNWTNNAEFKNDENIIIQKNDVVFASKFTRQFNIMWDRD